MRWAWVVVTGAMIALGGITASGAAAVTCSAPATIVVAPGQRVSVSVTANCTGAVSPLDYQLNVTHHPQHGYLESPVLAPATQDYVAPDGYIGPDQFSYTASRSAGAEPSAEVTQHIIVRAGANAPPTCTAPADIATVRQGTPKDLAISCTDPEGSSLTLSVVEPPAHGTATPSAGSVRYTTTDPGGDDRFSVRASDGSASSDPVEVRVRAVAAGFDTPPACVAGAAFSVHAGESAGPNGVLCSDADGDPLTYRVQRQATQGTATPTFSGALYSAGQTAAGTDSFALIATDGTQDSAQIEVSVTLLARRAPECETLNLANEHTAHPGDDLLLRLHCRPGNDGLPVAFVIDQQPAHGTLTRVSADATTADYRFRADGSAYRGADELRWHGEGPQGLTSTTATFALTIADPAANTAPNCFSGSEDGGTVRLGTTKVLTYQCTMPEPGDDYQIEVVTPPAHGQIVATSFAAPNTARISYRPDDGYDGLDGFQTRVVDGRGGISPTRDSRVMVVRADYNRPPRCLANGAQIGWGASATLGECRDPDGDAITYSIASPPAQGSAVVSPGGDGVRYTAPAGTTGSTTVAVSFVVTDALGMSRTWTYSVVVGTPTCTSCGPPSGPGGGGGGSSPTGGGGGAPAAPTTTPDPPAATPTPTPDPTPAPAPVPAAVSPTALPGVDLGDATAERPAGRTSGPIDVRGTRPVTLVRLRCATDCAVVSRPRFLTHKRVSGSAQRLALPPGHSGKLVVRVPASVRRQAPRNGRVRVQLRISVHHADGSVSRDAVTFSLRLRT